MWYVYIIKCRDGTFYTGITTDVERRIGDHNMGKGAKYTRGRGPVRLIYQCGMKSRAEASKEEYRIKQLSKTEKALLLGSSAKNQNSNKPTISF